MKIETSNGYTEIYPIFCEVTNKQIGWQTKPKCNDCIPAFISLKVVSKNGKQKISTKDIVTF